MKKETMLQKKADEIRERTLEMCIKAGTGHVTSSFSCAELLSTLYFGGVMKYDAKNPKWDERDRFILSKGQASPILYVTLAKAGFFPESWLETFCEANGHFGVHLQCDVPGVEFTTGSLGHGLGLGVGKALAARMDGKDYRTFVMLGDAELQEGSNWEAAMFASQQKLGNVTAIVDRNGYGVLCPTEQSAGLDSLESKFEAFGWTVTPIDGHSTNQLLKALDYQKKDNDKPRMIIAYTTKGKGIKSWENVALRHGTAPVGEEAIITTAELKEFISKREYE
jgi:transketolase